MKYIWKRLLQNVCHFCHLNVLTYLTPGQNGPISQTIFSDAFLAPNRRQAIIWTNADPNYWRIYVALGGDGLSHNNINLYQHGVYCIDIAHPVELTALCGKADGSFLSTKG